MSKNTLDDPEKKHALSSNQEEYNDDDLTDNIDTEAEKNKIVEYSPKGRFIRFNEELGSGAYKTVYKAYDNETGWEVAWNVIKLQRLPDKERKRISDEIALLKQLKHPNIIHFISAWINRQKEEVVFITEAVTGGSLKRYLKKIKRPRLRVIKTWCKEILQGIEYLHNLEPHPIIHRDIKCDNIFINSNKGEIRIGDLGLATFMSNAYADSLLGTPEFMAPEMYDEIYGPSVDIYSFGMCVLEMVTNETPYRECMNPAQIYRKVSKGEKPSSLKLIANEEVKNFIIECLKPKDERPTASELLKHRFVVVADSEIDNQPVALYESAQPQKFEEEIKESITSQKVQKLYQQALEAEDTNSEADNQKSESARSSDSKEEEKYDNQNQVTPEDKTIMNNTKNESQVIKPQEKQEQQTIKTEEKGRSQGKSVEMKVQDIKLNEENKEIKRADALTQQAKGRSGTEQKHEQVRIEEKKPEISKEAQELERLKQEQINQEKLKKQKESQLKQTQEEERKSSDVKRQTEDSSLQHTINKDMNRYSFYSKGIINNCLIIAIRYDGQDSSQEQLVEVEREKIYPEKIKRKLFKQLDLTNISDPYFIHHLNILYENLISQNILQPLSLLNNLTLPTHPKSVTNESHKSPDRSIISHNPNSVFFQPQQFIKFYNKYLGQVPREYLVLESEEAMNLRHQREILELENIHLNQKRNMWDRRQNIMSGSSTLGMIPNTLQFSTIDADDFYHKILQMNENSYRSEAKKKGSRGTDFTISSVDSATLSPTYSSGNNIHSMSNWGEPGPINLKKDEVIINVVEGVTHNTEALSEPDRSLSHAIHDHTVSQQGPHHQPLANSNGSTAIISPKGNTNVNANTSSALFNKHAPSNFANYAAKPTITKTQSDKIVPKEKKLNEPPQKEADTFTKRPSIEKNFESAQNLIELLHSPVQNPPQHIVQPAQSSMPDKSQNIPLQSKIEQEKSAQDVRYDKLTVNTNLSSPPEKANQPNLVTQPNPEIVSQLKLQQKPQSSNQLNTSGTIQKRTAQPMVGSSTPTNKSQNEMNMQAFTSSGNPASSLPNNQTVQNVNNQPLSATLKPTSNLLSQPLNPSLANANNKSAFGQTPTANSSAQKLSLTSQHSAGNLQTPPPQNRVPVSTPNNKTPANQNLPPDSYSKNITKSNEISQTPYMKLQTSDVVDRIKNHKLSGVLKIQDHGMNIEDVKMLQIGLEVLTESDILSNGHFNHYTENLLKTWQKSVGLPVTGVLDQGVWEKMIDALEKKAEKKKGLKGQAKPKETGEAEKGRDDLKKKIKDKQNKESSECLTKIESNLTDLSDLK